MARENEFVTIVQGCVVQGKVVEDVDSVEGLRQFVDSVKVEGQLTIVLEDADIRFAEKRVRLAYAVIAANSLFGYTEKASAKMFFIERS